ncbi:MAG: hypothetical protein IK104_01455 [Clostridia bacterium]|nr:hypothetical protein [Clostridia bacterium]
MTKMKKLIAVLLTLASLMLVFVPAVLAEEHVHTWNEGEQMREATCSQQGMIEYTCTGCGQKRREPTGYGPHLNTYVYGEREATCIQKGYTGDTYCRDCGRLVATGTNTEFAPHTPDPANTVNVPATCTTAGYDKSVCTVCGAPYEFNIVPAHGHKDADKDAKCDYCGTSMAYAGSGTEVCKVCGRVHNLDLADRIQGIMHEFEWFYTHLADRIMTFFHNLKNS